MTGRQLGAGVLGPMALAATVLLADVAEGPKTAYVGVLSAVPLLAAVLVPPSWTALVAVATWTAAWVFGMEAADGASSAQVVRLVVIAGMGVLAVAVARVRVRRERHLAAALALAGDARRLREQALTDVLTGLPNRRGLLDALDRHGDGEVTLALVDLDGLKQVNDRHGHLVGDEYLRAVAGRIRANLHRDDVVARWGGDEFVVVLPVPREVGADVMQRVRDRVTSSPFPAPGAMVPVGISVGVGGWDPGEDVDEVLARVDGAMYRAKASGGALVVAARA